MMERKLAEHIIKLRTEYPIHSWRRIAEVICDEYPLYIDQVFGNPKELRGNQLLGIELLRYAANTVGRDYHEIEEESERKLK